MEESILKIVKDKEDFKFSVEIKDNAKGEPQVTVKTRGDISEKDAGSGALAEYKRLRKELDKK